jgi:hypothetical protein
MNKMVPERRFMIVNPSGWVGREEPCLFASQIRVSALVGWACAELAVVTVNFISSFLGID